MFVQRQFKLMGVVGIASVAMAALAGWAVAGGGGNVTVTSRAVSDAELRELTQLVAARESLAPASRPVAHAEAKVDGATYVLETYRNTAGEACFSHRVSGGRSVGCLPDTKLFQHGPLYLTWGGQRADAADADRWDVLWLWGKAKPGVAELSVTFADCTAQRVELDGSGAFMLVAPAASLYTGGWPISVDARNRRGVVVHSAAVEAKSPLELVGKAPRTPVSRACR